MRQHLLSTYYVPGICWSTLSPRPGQRFGNPLWMGAPRLRIASVRLRAGTELEPRLSDAKACVVNLWKWEGRVCTLPRHLMPAWNNETEGEKREDQAWRFFKHLESFSPSGPDDLTWKHTYSPNSTIGLFRPWHTTFLMPQGQSHLAWSALLHELNDPHTSLLWFCFT